ncbi:MAG: DUF92 domain-containing protein [Candidatus Eremiobacteraeota bacterium]|nr:DUF92 domain-containing protein [Candidatus Eremiobacteraeota bacterium]MBV9264071.1 DUF92 domain-containing protein [Candidatus Eremiobacteraeota bacterium]
MTHAVWGFALAVAIALLAYRARALDASGAIAAVGVGTAIFATLGFAGAAVLLAFFVPASALTQLRRASRRGDESERRNAAQVLANGGVAALCALGTVLAPGIFAAGFAGAFAAAAADTWGTEIGTRYGGTPVSILTFARLPTGRSGGITLMGTLASIGGAAVVAASASAVHVAPFIPIAIGGVAGALLDSVVGATLQSLRWCPICRCECETKRHDCGAATSLRRGVSWMENDAVNVVATLAGAAVAALALRSP